MGPTEFLRKWLCLNKRFKRTSSGAGCSSFKKIAAQGFAHHPYGPTERVPKTRDVINMLAIRQLGKYLDQAARAGRITAKLPIYNTEFGLQSNPPDRLVSTSLARQAALINEKEEYAYRYSRLKSHSQYLLLDDPAAPRRRCRSKWSGFQTGLRFADGRRKSRLQRVPLPDRGQDSAARGVSIWGRVRPGSGVRSVQLQKGGRNSGPKVKTNSLGYFGVNRAVVRQLPLQGVRQGRPAARDEPHREADPRIAPMKALRLCRGGGCVGPPPPRSGLGLEVDVVRVRGPHRARAHDAGQAPADARADPPPHGRRHAARRGQVERGRAAALGAHQAGLRRDQPGRVSGLLPLRRPDRCARGRSACGSSSRSPATPRAGRPRAAAAAASRPPTGRSAPASTGALRPRSRGATRAASAGCRPCTTSRSGTSPTTATS